MASKGRAARKQRRVRAEKAEQRGLPQAEELPVPARLRPRLIDEAGAPKVAAYSPGTRGEQARAEAKRAAESGGLPTVAKVALGALGALFLVFLASHFRKADGRVGSDFPAEVGPSDPVVVNPTEIDDAGSLAEETELVREDPVEVEQADGSIESSLEARPPFAADSVDSSSNSAVLPGTAVPPLTPTEAVVPPPKARPSPLAPTASASPATPESPSSGPIQPAAP